MKSWRNEDCTVNGLEFSCRYTESAIEDLFLPLLRKLSAMQRGKDRRIIVFLAAPPAVGKSTLALYLEKLSKDQEDLVPVQALGMDGFHYPASIIARRTVDRDGETVPMKDVKGCPESFDLDGLRNSIKNLKNKQIRWPVYSRKLHDVIPDAETVNADIIILEGNYLLLDEPGWRELKKYSDYSVMVTTDVQILEERLIGRKVAGGLSEEEARSFYETSDKPNVLRVLNRQVPADLSLRLEEDGDFQKIDITTAQPS